VSTRGNRHILSSEVNIYQQLHWCGKLICWFESGESSDGEKDCSFVAVNKFFTRKRRKEKRRDFTDPLFEKQKGKTVGSASNNT
jgi:hypothetical protein